MPEGEKLYPFEVVVQGTPLSQQAKIAKHREAWKKQVTEAARKHQYETCEQVLLYPQPLAVTLCYFPSALMDSDIDNIVKPIMDALIGVAYVNDRIVERVTGQKFEPEVERELSAPSDQLALASDMEPPVVYIRVDDDLSWRNA
jgi:Holliday junction resolvase RusA-like endonuclease